ncbi:MAG: hypothetical protein Kow0013_24160 [Pararhodobacter sp.]
MAHREPDTKIATDPHENRARVVKSVKGTKGDEAREVRIKAALKANIARRKAQARARHAENDPGDDQ